MVRNIITYTAFIYYSETLRWHPTVYRKVEKCKFQPHKVCVLGHQILKKSVLFVAMRTLTFQNGRKCTFNPIYFINYCSSVTLIFSPSKHFFKGLVIN